MRFLVETEIKLSWIEILMEERIQIHDEIGDQIKNFAWHS